MLRRSVFRPRRTSSVAGPMLAALLFSLLAPDLAEGQQEKAPDPLRGQIVIDPEHPQWLMRHGGEHVFICGPGDPEGFLYRGKRRADGTRDGDQLELIDKLIRHGGNCIYMQTVRSHGGDGRPDENPFVNANPNKGADEAILDQWETWFRRMDDHGILIYLFVYDDGADPWRLSPDRDRVTSDEREFLTALVDRFEHHKNLIWVVAEECEEAFSRERVHAIAEVIRRADDHGHLVGAHHHSGTAFKFWQPGGPLNHYSMQLTRRGDAAHTGAVEAFRKAAGRYQVIYAESTAASPDAKHAWRSATGGLMPMLLEMDIEGTPPETLQRLRHLQRFFEATDFYTMEPHDDLAAGGTQYLLAAPARSYIAYAEKLSNAFEIKKLPESAFDVLWLDCNTGRRVSLNGVKVPASGAKFQRPEGVGPWCAAWIRRTENEDAGEGASDSRGNDGGQPRGSSARFPGKSWERRDPAEVGLDPQALDAFARAVGGDGVVVRDGYLVKSWGDPGRRRDWASAAKPVISTLLFFAVHEGRLESVDAPVRPWVRQRWPGKDLREEDRGMTFRHLADMTSGYARAEPPGSHWAYNDYAISLYRHMAAEVFGRSLNDGALARLGPLEFQDGELFTSRGGAGIGTSPRDFARIGWFWLNRGNWQGEQLLPAAYFDRYCRPDAPGDLPRTKAAGRDDLDVGSIGGGSDQNFSGQGVYGFNWWFNARLPESNERLLTHLPADAFFALGHEGREVMLMLPGERIVVAARGNWGGKRLERTALLAKAIGPGER